MVTQAERGGLGCRASHASARLGTSRRGQDVIGEFYENDFLRAKAYSARTLARDLVTRIQGTVSYTYCDMAGH